MCICSCQQLKKGKHPKYQVHTNHQISSLISHPLFSSQNSTSVFQKLEKDATTSPAIKDPAETNNPLEPEEPGDGAGASSLDTPTDGPAAADTAA